MPTGGAAVRVLTPRCGSPSLSRLSSRTSLSACWSLSSTHLGAPLQSTEGQGRAGVFLPAPHPPASGAAPGPVTAPSLLPDLKPPCSAPPAAPCDPHPCCLLRLSAALPEPCALPDFIFAPPLPGCPTASHPSPAPAAASSSLCPRPPRGGLGAAHAGGGRRGAGREAGPQLRPREVAPPPSPGTVFRRCPQRLPTPRGRASCS